MQDNKYRIFFSLDQWKNSDSLEHKLCSWHCNWFFFIYFCFYFICHTKEIIKRWKKNLHLKVVTRLKIHGNFLTQVLMSLWFWGISPRLELVLCLDQSNYTIDSSCTFLRATQTLHLIFEIMLEHNTLKWNLLRISTPRSFQKRVQLFSSPWRLTFFIKDVTDSLQY